MDLSFFENIVARDEVGHQQFFLNMLLAALLAYSLGMFYVRFGTAMSNRRKFARNFMLLALTTMMIIHIVQTSVALSLGLVGALSIVRFRAAIKEPEELAYLFLNVGIGLGMGANEPIITTISFVVILGLLLLQVRFVRKEKAKAPESMFVNITASGVDVKDITKTLVRNFESVQLKRMDQIEGRLHLSYLINTEFLDNIGTAKDELLELSPDLSFSFIEQRNLVG